MSKALFGVVTSGLLGLPLLKLSSWTLLVERASLCEGDQGTGILSLPCLGQNFCPTIVDCQIKSPQILKHSFPGQSFWHMELEDGMRNGQWSATPGQIPQPSLVIAGRGSPVFLAVPDLGRACNMLSWRAGQMEGASCFKCHRLSVNHDFSYIFSNHRFFICCVLRTISIHFKCL